MGRPRSPDTEKSEEAAVDIATDPTAGAPTDPRTGPTLGLLPGKPPERSPVLPAVIARLDRAGVEVRGRLGSAGLPVPWLRRVDRWSEVRAVAEVRRIVAKHVSGTIGRGARVWSSTGAPAPLTPPFDGPYVVEEYLECDQPELKIYRIGDHVAALLAATGENIDASPEVTDLAHRVAGTLGLSICGIDLRWDDDGPRVIDVNAFPSCRRVVGATRLVTDQLLARLTA